MFDGITLKTTMLLAGIALALSVLGAPLLETAVDKYAANRALGIDRVITSSINKGNRVIVRKSVLSDKVQRICEDTKKTNC